MVLLLATLMVGVRWLEKWNEQPEPVGDYRQRYAYEDLLEVDGVTYRPRRRLTTILLMGIDQDGETAAGVQSYRNGGQADFLRLIVIDSEQKGISQLQIDRDTMTPITVFGVLGNRSGVRTSQIALAHNFGNGPNENCELTVEAVSNLLMGIDIDFYAAMNMDGIAVLNDAVGGVTVTLEDDFSEQDGEMVKGETLKLSGEQATLFVRGRQSVGDGTNEARMKRQQAFISALGEEIVKRQSADNHFIEALYDDLLPYMTTNLSKGRLINNVWFAAEYEHAQVFALKGVHRVGGNGYVEFIADEESLAQTVLELFYEKVL